MKINVKINKMKDEIKNWYSELGKKAMASRWNGHTPMTKEELREYRRLKMREYRSKKKDENKSN